MTSQMIKTEPNYQNNSLDQPLVDPNDLNQVLKILQKYNLKVWTSFFYSIKIMFIIYSCITLKECEDSLKKELNKKSGMTDEQR